MRRALLASLVLCAASPARAEEGPSSKAAEALFREGKALLDGGKLEGACRILEESNALEPAGGTLLNLASCRERLGQYASAERALERARELAQKAGRPDALAFVEERLEAVRRNVSTLRVRLPSAGGALEVDGAKVAVAGREVTLRLDPGEHHVLWEREGQPVVRRKVTLEGAGKHADVELAPAAPPPPPPRAEPPRAVAPLETVAVVGVSLGAALLVGGGVTGGLAVDAWSQASSRCPQPTCADAVGVQRATDARGFADASTALFVSGAAILAAGVVLAIVPPLTRKKATSVLLRF